MAATQERIVPNMDTNATTTTTSKSESPKIDLTAPAGSKRSLGEESIRDGRPSTDDDAVEAIDEANPGVPVSSAH